MSEEIQVRKFANYIPLPTPDENIEIKRNLPGFKAWMWRMLGRLFRNPDWRMKGEELAWHGKMITYYEKALEPITNDVINHMIKMGVEMPESIWPSDMSWDEFDWIGGHDKDNPNCEGCQEIDEVQYPISCKCGGLIHFHSYAESGPDAWNYFWKKCDKCDYAEEEPW